MTIDPIEIEIENFRECMRKYERYTAFALAASFSFLMFTVKSEGPNAITVLWSTVPMSLAVGLALGAFLLFEILALSSINRANTIIQDFSRLSNDLRRALANYPSMATSTLTLYRIGTAVLPFIFVLSSLIHNLVGTWDQFAFMDRPWGGWAIIMLIFGVSPALIVVKLWRDPFGAPKKNNKSNDSTDDSQN